MFGWSEGNTVNRFLNSISTFFKTPFTGCNFEMFELSLVLSAHINIEIYMWQ